MKKKSGSLDDMDDMQEMDNLEKMEEQEEMAEEKSEITDLMRTLVFDGNDRNEESEDGLVDFNDDRNYGLLIH